MDQSKRETCKYHAGYVDKDKDTGHAVVVHACRRRVCSGDGQSDVDYPTEQQCDACPDYESRYIQYPIQVSSIDNKDPVKVCASPARDLGAPVVVEPCSDGPKGRFLGILLGDFPIAITTSYDPTTGALANSVLPNPAIWVPAMGRIIYGAESWWCRVTSHDQLDKGLLDAAPVWMPGYIAAWLAEHPKGETKHA